MFKKPTKKQFLIRRIILSIVATISVIIIVTVSILFMLGYRLDSGNGRLEQGALLQFDSTPGAAQVWIDGRNIGSQTATKQTVVAGEHTVLMSKNGYEDWTRTLRLDAGTLTWLDYTRLVPTSRPVQAVGYYDALASMRFSSDLKWAIGHELPSSPTFRLIDLRANDIKNSFITLSPEIYTDSAIPESNHTFTVHRWSSGARYAVVKHTYGDAKTEWILLDTEDVTRSVNVSRTLNVELSDVRFASNSGMALFGLTADGVLRKLDISNETISRGLVTNVRNFSVYEDTSTVTYVGADPANESRTVAGIYKDGDTAPKILRAIDTNDTPLYISIARYFGDDYVAIAEGKKVTVFMGNLSSVTQTVNTLRQFATLSLGSNVTSLNFSPSGEYVLAQAGSEFATYELEHQRGASGTVTATEGKDASTLKWLDAAHLWNDDANTLTMRDFDNANSHAIMAVESGYGASLSQNGRFFYSVGKAEDGRYQLQRVRMILN